MKTSNVVFVARDVKENGNVVLKRIVTNIFLSLVSSAPDPDLYFSTLNYTRKRHPAAVTTFSLYRDLLIYFQTWKEDSPSLWRCFMTSSIPKSLTKRLPFGREPRVGRPLSEV